MKESKSFEKNIISWYPFEENIEILEIKNDFELDKSVLFPSVDVTTCKVKKEVFQSLDKSKKWDYITLLGSLEESVNCFQNAEELFLLLKELLKENGKILIATDNKFGISNWIGKENNIAQSTAFSKQKLDNLFHNVHFEYIKYYYPLPNYKIANVIYTDTMLPNVENISRNLTLYEEKEIINGNQTSIYQEILKNNENDFPHFANSFFIELGLNPNSDNEIKFISFSNLRKSKYQVQTVVKKEEVYKKAVTKNADEHIQNMKRNIDILKELGVYTLDSYDEKQIISKYTNESSLDKVIVKLLQEDKKEECINLVNRFANTLRTIPLGEKENSIFEKYNIMIEEEKKEKLHFLKYGLWDLIFQNCFLINNEFYFYDQEWYDENVPLEYILYRAIIYLPNITKYIPQEEWMKQLNIIDFKEEFQLLDNKIQEEIRDEDIWRFHTDALNVTSLEKKYIQEIEIRKERETYIKDIENDNEKKQEYIISLEKGQEELKAQLEYEKNVVNNLINSTSWKITEPIRRVTKLFKKEERKDLK